MYWRTERDYCRTVSGLDGSLLGSFLKEFEGLAVLTGEAAHPDRRKHVKVYRIVDGVVGQRDIGYWTEGNVDEGEVSFAEGERVKKPAILRQGNLPRVFHRHQNNRRPTEPSAKNLKRRCVRRPFTLKLMLARQAGF